LSEIQIVETIGQTIPTMSMVVNDVQDFFSDNYTLTDGNKIELVIGQSESEVSDSDGNVSKKFRVFSYKGKQYQTGFRYVISGIYDCPKFTTNVSTVGIRGTSEEVLAKIAQESGFEFVSDQTQDTQAWINISDTYLAFARKITQYSYIPNGLMLLTVNSDNTMFYRDVFKLLAQSPEYTIATVDGTSAAYTAAEWEVGSSAGLLNYWVNYGYNLVEPKLDGTFGNFKDINIRTDAFLPVNQEVCDSMDFTRRDYSPIDCGNTHKNYWTAYHQNIRRMALFSQRVLLLTTDVTNMNPGETINFTQYNSVTSRNTGYSGVYLITAKKTIIRGTKYSEIFELMRPSVRSQGKTRLVGG
jgi:hypothetical protein